MATVLRKLGFRPAVGYDHRHFTRVVGSIPALGSWNTASAVPLSSAGYPVWSAGTPLPANTSFQYKYIKKNPDGSITWESDPNRAASTGTGPLVLNDTWR